MFLKTVFLKTIGFTTRGYFYNRNISIDNNSIFYTFSTKVISKKVNSVGVHPQLSIEDL